MVFEINSTRTALRKGNGTSFFMIILSLILVQKEESLAKKGA